jgi:hypothetical protein
MHADAEHQQHDAEFGELSGEPGIGDKAGGERPDRDAGEKIADDRRQTEAQGGKTADEGKCQPDGDRRDQPDVVRHLFRAKGAEPQTDIIGDPHAGLVDQHRA